MYGLRWYLFVILCAYLYFLLNNLSVESLYLRSRSCRLILANHASKYSSSFFMSVCSLSIELGCVFQSKKSLSEEDAEDARREEHEKNLVLKVTTPPYIYTSVVAVLFSSQLWIIVVQSCRRRRRERRRRSRSRETGNAIQRARKIHKASLLRQNEASCCSFERTVHYFRSHLCDALSFCSVFCYTYFFILYTFEIFCII